MMISRNYLSVFYHCQQLRLSLIIRPFSSENLTLMLKTFSKGFIYLLISEVILQFFMTLFVSCVQEWKKLQFDLQKSTSLVFLSYRFHINFHILSNPHRLLVEDHFRQEDRFFKIHPNAHQSMLSLILKLILFLTTFLQESTFLSYLSTYVDF